MNRLEMIISQLAASAVVLLKQILTRKRAKLNNKLSSNKMTIQTN